MGGAGHWEVVAQWRSCHSACKEEATLPASNGLGAYVRMINNPNVISFLLVTELDISL